MVHLLSNIFMALFRHQVKSLEKTQYRYCRNVKGVPFSMEGACVKGLPYLSTYKRITVRTLVQSSLSYNVFLSISPGVL